MSSSTVLPPGVSQGLFSALAKATYYYDGQGQAGSWTDPQNWWAGAAPSAGSFVLVPISTTLNGAFTAKTVMLLGTETVAINGELTTTNTNFCESFMVCDGAVANFADTSVLNDAGALIVGNEDAGVLTAVGTPSQYSTLTTLDARIGRLVGGIGTVTIDGAQWSNSLNLYVGLQGNGTLNVLDDGQVKEAASMFVGQYGGAVGVVNLSSGATLSIADSLNLGEQTNSVLGSGSATLTVGSGALLSVGKVVSVFANETLYMAGGTLALGSQPVCVRVMQGSDVAGYGLVNAGNSHITDDGTITAAGGTLVLQSASLPGLGALQIEAGATLGIMSPHLGGESIAFLGADATLNLADNGAFNMIVTGFAAGDRIVLPAADHIIWNASLGVLYVIDENKMVDTLHFTGMTGSNPFTLSQAGGEALIAVSSGH